MNDLKEIFDWLAADPLHRLEIYDVVSEKALDKSVPATKIGGTEAYLQKLVDRGITKIAVQRAKRQGSTQVRIGIMHKFEIGPNKSLVAPGGNTAQAAPLQPSQNGFAGMGFPGMGFADMIRTSAEASKYQDLREENKELKAKLEKITDERDELRISNLGQKKDLEAGPSTVEKVFSPEMIQSLTGLVSAAMQAKNAQPALNAPAAETLSQVKAALVQVLNREDVTDDIALGAYHVLSQSAQGNQKFIDAFKKILKDNNLLSQPQKATT